MNQGRTRCVTYLTCLITVTANLAVKWSGLWGSMSTYRYWRCVIFILAMFHFQVLWNRLRKPQLVPLARKVDFWNWYGILSIFRRSIWLLFMNRCFEAQLWYVNVDIARSVRIIKQNAMQSFLCRLWESALRGVNECELTNHSGYLNLLKTYEILMLLKGSPTIKISLCIWALPK